MTTRELPTGREILDAVIKRPELHDFFADCVFTALELLHMLSIRPDSAALTDDYGVKTDNLLFIGPISQYPSGVAYVLEQVAAGVQEIDFGILDKDNPYLTEMWQKLQTDSQTETIRDDTEGQHGAETIH